MSTYVPNVGSVKPYEAESLDSRLRKRRDEHQARRRQSQSSDEPTQGDDGQVLSVQAIILFLEDFLESRLGERLKKDAVETQNAFEQWFEKKPSNCNEAVQAYQHGAETSQFSLKHSSPQSSQQDIDLSHIYGLIRDLRDLKDSGVYVLRLASDMDFIHGISFAVEDARQREER